MEEKKTCIFDENKPCDNCGDCRCDLDPNKICDNCCRCLALDDEDGEYRSFSIGVNGSVSRLKKPVAAKKQENTNEKEYSKDITDEPYELTPELVEYWENKLLEYGEAPADDGFGEIEVSVRNPVYGKRKKTVHEKKH